MLCCDEFVDQLAGGGRLGVRDDDIREVRGVEVVVNEDLLASRIQERRRQCADAFRVIEVGADNQVCLRHTLLRLLALPVVHQALVRIG